MTTAVSTRRSLWGDAGFFGAPTQPTAPAGMGDGPVSMAQHVFGRALTKVERAALRVANAGVALGAIAVAGMAGIAGLNTVVEDAQAEDRRYVWAQRAPALMGERADVTLERVLTDEHGTLARLSKAAVTDDARADRAATLGLQTFNAAHFDHAQRQRTAMDCMARAIYYEARAEPLLGQLAVADVVLHRVRHAAYPNEVCDVVYEGSHLPTGCQFTFTCDGAENRTPRGRPWRVAHQVAAHAMMGLSPSVTQDATHYHADYVDPYWAPSLLPTETIGTHIFYKTPRRYDRRGLRGA